MFPSSQLHSHFLSLSSGLAVVFVLNNFVFYNGNASKEETEPVWLILRRPLRWLKNLCYFIRSTGVLLLLSTTSLWYLRAVVSQQNFL